MTELRQRMIHDMQIRNYSPRTIQVYVYHVGCFAKFCLGSPLELGPEDVRRYQVYLVETKKVSWSSFNQAVCALRFLYRTTIPRDWPVTMIPFAKKPKRLPTVLGPDEVQRLLAHAYPLKHRTVLTVLYAAGLRLEEGLQLKCTDLDSQRMLLRVACGKGAKERLVPFSTRLLERLRESLSPFGPPISLWDQLDLADWTPVLNDDAAAPLLGCLRQLVLPLVFREPPQDNAHSVPRCRGDPMTDSFGPTLCWQVAVW